MRTTINPFLLVALLCSMGIGRCATVVADDSEYKLLPLRYNNPGLAVDLGVGLWAYPMPLDYDGDGDMDLLVGCPDKPSQGTYFFENPSQDPDDKLPVFNAGVRIGDGFHYMMLSEMNGEAVILKPGAEYRREPGTGKFDFSKPKPIDAPSNPHYPVMGRTRANMWRYVDYDGDKDHDIVVGIGDWSDLGWDHAYDNRGVWRNGPLHGYVYLIVNEGSNQKPTYSRSPQRLQAGGGDIDVYGWPSPNFADFDGDGDLDLLCGEFLDGFTYFTNIGSRESPTYAAGVKLLAADGRPLKMHLQMITPTAVDWDRDGDLDLIVGDEDGRVALVENTGTFLDSAPVFKSPEYFQQYADTLKFGALATPYVYDWDNDGDEDIVCGNTAGSIGVFENLGTAANGLPMWHAPQLLNVISNAGELRPFRIMAGPNGSIQGPCEAKWGYTTLSVADWDKDGDGDIIYNSILGRVGLLINDSGNITERRLDSGLNELPPAWYWWQTPSNSTLTQWRTTPLAVDFDRDEKLDLVLLDQEGYLTLRRGGKTAERIFVDEDNSPLRLNSGTCGRSGRVKLALVDWDGDSRLDLLVNSENATWYRNCEERDGKIVFKRVGNLARRNVAGHTSSPTVCDFDRDGKPDLLVGSENGRIYHIMHDDCIKFDAEQTEARAPATPKRARFPGVVSEEFVFPNSPFEECGASTICQTTRGLVAAWSGGQSAGGSDVGIWASYHDGLKWSAPQEVASGVQHEQLRYPCWNPVLYQPPGDAPTLLFFKVGPSQNEWWAEVMISYDRGRTFVHRKRLPEGIDGPGRCKPILLPDATTLLCGSSTENDGWQVHFELTKLIDGQPGTTWKRVGPLNDAPNSSTIQPTFLKHTDGRLQVLCRSGKNIIATSFSSDGGQTWSPLADTDIRTSDLGADAITLANGLHVLVYAPPIDANPDSDKRGKLSLAASLDGRKWNRLADLEREGDAEFGYPAIIQSSDGLLHVTYTDGRQKIKHLSIDPAQLPSNQQ